MSEMDTVRRNTQADLLKEAAGAVENSVVGIISLVLPNEALDKEMLQIRQDLLIHAHRLRQIATQLSTEKR